MRTIIVIISSFILVSCNTSNNKVNNVNDIPQMIYENLYLQYENNEKVLQEYNNNIEYYNLLFKDSE